MQSLKLVNDKDKVPQAQLSEYHGPVYVGIDAGSTTAKLAVIGSNRSYYIHPMAVIMALLSRPLLGS